MVKLTPDKEYTPTKVPSQYGVMSYYVPVYRITKEDVQILSEAVITKVRITFERSVDFNPKKGEAKDILVAAGCLLKD